MGEEKREQGTKQKKGERSTAAVSYTLGADISQKKNKTRKKKKRKKN